MAEVMSLAIPESPNHSRDFQKGYESVQCFFKDNIELKVSVEQGKIHAKLDYAPLQRGQSTKLTSCRRLLSNKLLLGNFFPQNTLDIMANALSEEYPSYDWDHIADEIPNQPYKEAPIWTTAHYWPGESGKLWSIIGAMSGMTDLFVKALINIDERSVVRVIAGISFQEFRAGQQFIDSLLDTGLEYGPAALFCAVWLAEVHPRDPKMSASVDQRVHIGYWNGEQGILLTTVFLRSLACDIPKEKRRPFTLHNIPILGMPTDDGGWIKPSSFESFSTRLSNPSPPPFSPNCDVTLEYRPHFGGDSNSVAAAVYINGVYFGLCAVTNMYQFGCSPYCDHLRLDSQRLEGNDSLLDLSTFDPGKPLLLRNNVVALVGPQFSSTSRFVSVLLYAAMCPVVRNGCLSCAYELARSSRSCVIVDMIAKKVTTEVVRRS